MAGPIPIQFQTHDTPEARLEKLKRLAEQLALIPDLSAIITQQTTRIDALEARIAELESP